MNKKKRIMKWVQIHKAQLIAAGISVTFVVALILCCRNKKSMYDLWEVLKRRIGYNATCVQSGLSVTGSASSIPLSEEIMMIDTTSFFDQPIEVRSHIRTLHEGWKPSAEKVAMARSRGIILAANQTWVESYTKCA